MDFLSSLPAISLLNGSVVTDSEREDAERFFIRYHVEFPEKELPFRSAADMVTREVLFFFVYILTFPSCLHTDTILWLPSMENWNHSLRSTSDLAGVHRLRFTVKEKWNR